METLPEQARSPIVGPYATCEEADLSPLSARAHAALTSWLVTSASYHPVFTQWILYAVHLRDVSGVGPPVMHFDGATHEIAIIALHPDHLVAVDDMADPDWRMHYLEPISLVHQFVATDEEIRYVVALMAWSISAGHNTPEPDSPDDVGWLSSITKTLAHCRGEVHAP